MLCFLKIDYVLSVPDKNFALEYYGSNSRCFDHTDQMWEEQTCTQIRQWQHWGSGCYQYKCYNGRLHILVSIRELFIPFFFIRKYYLFWWRTRIK